MLEFGNIFTDGTMPAAVSLPGTGKPKRRPGQIFFFFFFLWPNIRVRDRTRVVVNRADTRAFDYPSQP